MLREWGLREDGLHTAQLVISELVGNAVRHAVPHTTRATVKLARTSATLTLTVHDGHPALPRLRFAADPEQDGGRGLMIVDCLAREAGGALQIRRTPRHGKEVRGVPRRGLRPRPRDGLPGRTVPVHAVRRGAPTALRGRAPGLSAPPPALGDGARRGAGEGSPPAAIR